MSDSDSTTRPQVSYTTFLRRKSHEGEAQGFAPLELPSFLYDFQRDLVDWALRKGRDALFADCGLGKTPMQLVWAQNVVQKTNRPVLILTPLAVGYQTQAEGDKFGLPCQVSRDGSVQQSRIIITNYERLHYFSSQDFAGVVCDESSILKHFSGATQKAVTRFLSKVPYRLLCTATAAPNDYTELGTSSEALGELGYSDMLGRFFVKETRTPHRLAVLRNSRQHTRAHTAYQTSNQMGEWRMKGHAEEAFWRWVCSWARACRMPADLGYANGAFVLPPLEEQHTIIQPHCAPDGYLFTREAVGLTEERLERRRTIAERCEAVAAAVAHDRPAVIWCHLNSEGDELARRIPEAVQVSGHDTEEQKVNAYRGFQRGDIRVLITKPKIGAWGLNWQHCAHVVTFVSHSFEQYYQSIRRCWRFGQQSPVRVDVIASSGEAHVRDNMLRKSAAATVMFDRLIALMHHALHVSTTKHPLIVETPSWLSKTTA